LIGAVGVILACVLSVQATVVIDTVSYSKIRTCLISTAYVNSLNRYQDLTLYQYSGEINIENFFQAHF
jgi:hypothetical protein